MKVSYILVVVVALYLLVGYLDTPYDYEISNWGEWADVGCTEESRIRGSDFDRACSDFESNHTGE